MQLNKNKLTVEDISDWLQLPVTQAYFKRLKEEADIRREVVASGGVKKTTAYETGEEYIRALTQAEVYEAAASPTVEDILEENE